MIKVLFVCMGNICRSPTAEGVFRHLLRENNLEDLVDVDSAGTHGYHVRINELSELQPGAVMTFPAYVPARWRHRISSTLT